jgi:hypothetical protein
MTERRAKLPWHLFKAEHKAVGRSVCFALGVETTDAWFDLAEIIFARLTLEEKAGLAFAAMRALPSDIRWDIVQALGEVELPTGSPLPPFTEDIASDANWWASSASNEELRAYFVAIINYMSDDDKKIAAQKLLRKQ